MMKIKEIFELSISLKGQTHEKDCRLNQPRHCGKDFDN